MEEYEFYLPLRKQFKTMLSIPKNTNKLILSPEDALLILNV